MQSGIRTRKSGALNSIEGCFNIARNGCIWLFLNLFLLAFLVWGGLHAYGSWLLVSSGEQTTGTVVALDESSSDDGVAYSPIVEFTASGQTYSFESGNASDPPAYRIGQEVSVLYDPAAPEQARIESFSELWLFPAIIIPIMLLVLLILNIVFLVMAMRGKLSEDMDSS